MVLEFLVEKKAFHFSKKALCEGTACNKWLKKAMKGHSAFQKVARLWSKRWFFGKFTWVNLICFLCPIILQSLKETLKQILRYKLPSFWATIEPRLPILPKRVWFLHKVHFISDLNLFIAPYHSAKFEKKSLDCILRYKLV